MWNRRKKTKGKWMGAKKNGLAGGCLSCFKLKIKEPYRSHLESKMLFITAPAKCFWQTNQKLYYEKQLPTLVSFSTFWHSVICSSGFGVSILLSWLIAISSPFMNLYNLFRKPSESKAARYMQMCVTKHQLSLLLLKRSFFRDDFQQGISCHNGGIFYYSSTPVLPYNRFFSQETFFRQTPGKNWTPKCHFSKTHLWYPEWMHCFFVTIRNQICLI